MTRDRILDALVENRRRESGITPAHDVIIDATIARAVDEIRQDIATGRVPATVATFGELHDYVDANCYGGMCDEAWPGWAGPGSIDLANEVQNAVHAWLVAGRPCTCGHPFDDHQTGTGPWSGFCAGTLGQLGGEYVGPGDDPNEPCSCESPVAERIA